MIEEYYKNSYKSLVKRAWNNSKVTYWDAEDIVQTAFLRALRYINPDNPPRNINTWFISILDNVVKDMVASGMNFESIEVKEYHMVSEEKDDDAIRQEALEIAREKIKRIKSEGLRNVIYLYYIDGCKAREVADILGLKENTVKVMITRFKGKVRA